MKLEKSDIKKIKNFFGRLPEILAEKTFLSFIFLFLISSIFGAIVFYQYESLIRKASTGILEKSFKIEEKSYQEVLQFWEEKEKKLNEIDSQEYPDLFRGTILKTLTE